MFFSNSGQGHGCSDIQIAETNVGLLNFFRQFYDLETTHRTYLDGTGFWRSRRASPKVFLCLAAPGEGIPYPKC